MAIRERYQYVVDLVVDNANRALGTFGSNVDGVERSTGRLQGTLGRAGDFLRTHMAEAATAAGTALVAFGVKSVKAFQDSAIEAGRFADATGLSTDAASRWIEVAGDIGVSGENVRGLFTRLNKAIGDNAPVVSELGIETQKLADGTTDVNGTMLVAIERLNRIKNPTERAAAAQRLFGRNYAETAELIFGSADELRSQLEGVSDAIAIDDEERVKAERLRAAFDTLGDAMKEVQMIVGEQLAPKIVETVALMQDLRSAMESIPGADEVFGPISGAVQSALNPIGSLVGMYSDTKAELDGLIDSEKEFKDVIDIGTDAVAESIATREESNDVVDTAAMYAEVAAAKTQALADAEAAERAQAQRNIDTTKRLTDEYNDQRDAVNDLIGKKNELVGGDIAVRQAQRDAKAAVDELNTVLAEQGDDLGAVGAALDSTVEKQLAAAQAAADYRADQMEANGTLVDAKVRNQLLRDELSTLAAQFDGPLRAAIQRYIDQLLAIPTSINTRVTANGTPTSIPRLPGSQYAAGTLYHPGGAASFNEPGNPEMAVFPDGSVFMPDMPAGSKVLRMGRAMAPGVAAMGGGSGSNVNVNVTVNAGMGTSGTQVGRQIVEVLDMYARSGGQFPATITRRLGP